MKKILSGILLMILCIPSVGAIDYVSPEYSYARMQVMQTPYKKYVGELETVLPQLSYEKLEEIYERTSELQNNNSDIQKLIDFIEQATLEQMLMKDIEDVITEAQNPILETLSQEEKNKAQAEIQIFQSVMQEELLDLMDAMMLSFEKMQNYEQKGDIDVNFSMNIPDFMEYNFGINFGDYISRNVGFDSSFESDFSINAELKSMYENFDGEFSGNIDVISKGGDIYIKTDDMSINASELLEEEFSEAIEKLNTLGKDNTYLHIKDEASAYLISFLENLSMDEVERHIKEISTMNLLEAYGKDENAYLLRPTQEMCSLMKEALSIFDPFGGKSCSDAQYQNMLEDFSGSGISLKLIPGNTKNLILDFNRSDVGGQVEIQYSAYGLISVIGEIFEPGNALENTINFSYFPDKELDFSINLENSFMGEFYTKFGRNNTITSIASYAKYTDGDDSVIFTGEYNNSILNLEIVGILEDINIDCDLSGNVRETYGSLAGACNIRGENYFGETEIYESEYSLSYDLRSGKNNMDANFEFSGPEDMSFDMQVKNKGTIRYSSISEIKAPTKTKDFEEFMQEVNPYNSYYDDSSYSDYEVITNEYSDFSETCYNYENGDYSCTKYYNNGSVEYCSFYTAFDEEEYCTKY